MSAHLSDDVLIEMAEASASRKHADAWPRTGHAHLAECARCHRAFEDARAALLRLGGVDVPEPSPLFWDRLSARVHSAIESGDVGMTSARAWPPALGWRPAILAALTVLLAVLAASQIVVRRHEAAMPVFVRGIGQPAPAARPSQASTESGVTAEAEASWQLVREMTSTADFDTATQAGGFGLQPGAAERAALQLSPDEQRELVRLLQEAVGRPE